MALKGMRVKAQDNKNYGSTRVEFDSSKNRCRVVAQSMLEYIEFMRLELDPEVVSYTPHPGTIVIKDPSGTQHRSVFDAEVKLIGDRLMYEEIKYASEIREGTDSEDPFRSRRQINVQREWCRQNGYEYRVVTDEDLFRGKPALLSNLIFITQRLRPERIEDMSEVRGTAASVYNRIKDNNGRCIINTLIKDNDKEIIMTAICYLIKEGFIIADLDNKAICYGSEVRINA